MRQLGAQRLSAFFARCAYGVCVLLVVLIGYQTLSHQSALLGQLLGGLGCAVLAAGLLWLAGELAGRLGWRLTLAGLLALCLALRLFWVFHVSIEPAGDYQVFYGVASVMAESYGLWANQYLSLFPHVMGYSWFLSLFYRVLGPSPLLASLVNAGLSTLSCALLFFLSKKLFGVKAAAMAGLMWALFPSQIIYNMFVLSEPLYTALILAFLLAAVHFDGRADGASYKTSLALGALTGLLGAAVDLCRPVGAILLLCLLLWLGLVRLEKWKGRVWRRNAMCFLLVLLAVYGLTGRLGHGYLDRRLGVKSATTPGYNILVGFNARSGGLWNPEDSALLYETADQPGATPSSTQAQMLDYAKERITSGDIDFCKLFGDKLYHLMGRDDNCVDYAASVLDREEMLSKLCNVYWYMALFLALAGLVRALISAHRGGLFPAMLYFVGLVLAHMLVEVAGRYHYSLLISVCLLAAYGAVGLQERAAHLVGPARGEPVR